MSVVLAAIATLLCLRAIVVVIRYYLNRGRLTSKVFAFTVAIGWSLALMVFYFVNLLVSGKVEMNYGLVILGLAIGLVNLLIGLPLAYWAHKYGPFRFIKPPHSK